MSKKYNIDERAQKQWENYSIFSIVHALVEKNKDNGLFNISLKYYPQPLYPDIADVYDENNPAYKSLKNLKNINMINPSLEKIKGQDLRAIRAAQGICFRALARFPQFSQMSNIMLYDINNNKNLAMSEFLERLSNISDKNPARLDIEFNIKNFFFSFLRFWGRQICLHFAIQMNICTVNKSHNNTPY